MKLRKSIYTFIMAAIVACMPAIALIPCTDACKCACCHKVHDACCAAPESAGNGRSSTCCGAEANDPGSTFSRKAPTVAAPGPGLCQCTSIPDIRIPLNTNSQNAPAASGAVMRPAGTAPALPGLWPAGSPSRRSWNVEVQPHLFHCVFLC